MISDIKNVTNRQTEYGQLWGGLDYISGRFDMLALKPIEVQIERHQELFKTSYESLS